MSSERKLLDALRRSLGPAPLTIYQGIVVSVEGTTCTCRFGSAEIAGIRLRASLTERDRQMLVVPKSGSAVVVGSLSGDLSDLVILQVDEVESIVFNGGHLGGLINIEALVSKLNALIDAFNAHSHTIAPAGLTVEGNTNVVPVTVPAVQEKAEHLSAGDFEDKTILH